MLLTLSERGGVRVPSVDRVGTTSNGAVFLVMRAPPTRPARRTTSAPLTCKPTPGGRYGSCTAPGSPTATLRSTCSTSTRTVVLAGGLRQRRDRAVEQGPCARRRGAARGDGRGQRTRRRGRHRRLHPRQGRGRPGAADAPTTRLLPTTRARAKEVPGLLDDLRDSVNRATGEPGLGLARLERVRPRTLLIIAASTLAFYSLLPQLANLDDTVDSFQHAEPLWIVAALLASAVTYLFAAVSFQGAVSDDVPFGANVRVQVASSFVMLVGPGGAGGYAVGARFLQRTGVGGPEAAASVAVKTIAGFAMHIVLLVGFIVWAGNSDFGEFRLPSTPTVLLIIVVVLALVGVLVAIGPVRQRFLAPAWQGVKTGVAQIGDVFRQPIRWPSSSVVDRTQPDVHRRAHLLDRGVRRRARRVRGDRRVYLVAVAIATLAPTPGGLGAAESALIAARSASACPTVWPCPRC